MQRLDEKCRNVIRNFFYKTFHKVPLDPTVLRDFALLYKPALSSEFIDVSLVSDTKYLWKYNNMS